MLADREFFAKVEMKLIEDGMIKRFEEEGGKITGRMMIVNTEVPHDLKDKIMLGKQDYAFEATFDFLDVAIGIALDTKGLKNRSGFWLRAQVDDPEEPQKEWAEYFINTLVKHINSDGTFSDPILTFITEKNDFTIVPTKG